MKYFVWDPASTTAHSFSYVLLLLFKGIFITVTVVTFHYVNPFHETKPLVIDVTEFFVPPIHIFIYIYLYIYLAYSSPVSYRTDWHKCPHKCSSDCLCHATLLDFTCLCPWFILDMDLISFSLSRLCFYSFFQLLTSLCPICSHIFKTLNTISTTSVCCDHTIITIHVVFTQYSVNWHTSKQLKCSFHTSLPHTKNHVSFLSFLQMVKHSMAEMKT